MKRILVSSLIATGFLACTVSAYAQSVTFNVTGTITPPGTCQWAVGDANRTVTLDPISMRTLPASGAAGFKNFSLTLLNCTDTLTSATFTFAGTPDTNNPLMFQNTGDAGDMAIVLESMDGQMIGANGTNNARTVPITAKQAVLNLQVGYWRLGSSALTSGIVNAVSTVTLSYN